MRRAIGIAEVKRGLSPIVPILRTPISLEKVPEKTLILANEEREFQLKVVTGLYCVLQDELVSLSIETEALPMYGEAIFCVTRVPLEVGLKVGACFRVPYEQRERDSFDQPAAHLYFITHDDPAETDLAIVAVGDDWIELHGGFLWHKRYDPDSGSMRYCNARIRARCIRANESELRNLM